jgi:hypothetical protein
MKEYFLDIFNVLGSLAVKRKDIKPHEVGHTPIRDCGDEDLSNHYL